VEHPAAKIMVLASQMQEQEVGDGTNFVILLAGALLEGADELLRMVSIMCFLKIVTGMNQNNFQPSSIL